MKHHLTLLIMAAVSATIKDNIGDGDVPMDRKPYVVGLPGYEEYIVMIMKLPIDNLNETISNYYSIVYLPFGATYPIDVADVFFENEKAIVRHIGKEAIIADQDRGLWIQPDNLIALIDNIIDSNDDLLTTIGGKSGNNKDRKGG